MASGACTGGTGVIGGDPLAHFARMISNCLEYATRAKAQGRPVVGILCEFCPRELIMAAGGGVGGGVEGGVPVCLCGGSATTIPAAEQHLPSNLCPLIKSTFGYHVQGSNPFLEMADLVVAETTCDGKKKMYELMGETRPMFVLQLPYCADGEGRAKALGQWHGELIRLKGALEAKFGTEITREKLMAAIATMNRERMLRRKLASLMKRDPPPLTGRQLLDLRSSISGIPEDLAQYERAYDHFAAAPPPTGGRKTRVLMTGAPMVHGAERVIDLVESAGGVVVAMESCAGLKPILEDVEIDAHGDGEEPLRAIARKYFHLPCACMTRNTRRLDTLRSLAKEYRAECVVELIWQACLTYDVEAHYVRKLAEEELGIPYLRIETDYSPSDSARLLTRLEALYETVRSRGVGA